MTALSVGLLIVSWLIRIYIYVLWARLVLEWVMVFKRDFRPRGFWLVPVELVFTLTDPPIKFFRKLLPPIRLGQVSIDLGWMITMFCCWLALIFIPVIPV